MKYIDETAGIFLRPMTLDDTELIVKWRNLDEVRNNFLFRETFTNEMHENWYRTRVLSGDVVQFMICLTENNAPIGSVYIRDIDKVNKKAEYGIFIGEKGFYGRGIGTATAKLMLKYCFEEAKLHRVYLRAISSNERAIRSYEKAGFKKEGLLINDVKIGGEYLDIVWMAAVNTEVQ